MNLARLKSHLWDYSLQLYQQPGVEALCLELQDHWGADVNILLWLCWLEREGLAINDTRLYLAQARIATWQTEIVQPLRRMRRHIKQHYGTKDPQIEASRQAIKAAELQAEKAVQTRLESLGYTWLSSAGTRRVPNGANLSVYARILSLPEDKELELRQRLQLHL